MTFKKNDAVKAYGFGLRPSQIAELKKVAKRKERSMSACVRIAISRYLESEGKRHAAQD